MAEGQSDQDAKPPSRMTLDFSESMLSGNAPTSAVSSAPPTPGFPQTPSGSSRSGSFSGGSMFQEHDDMDGLPPLDRLTIFDFLENLELPQKLERIQQSLAARTEKVRYQQKQARKRVAEEWRKRVPPTAEEQMQKYQKRMKGSVDRVSRRWTNATSVTLREKLSFIAGVLNVFGTGYLIGALPEYVYLWYSVQMLYFYPLRFYSYHKKGYHYFLVDLCYFVNLLLLLSIWVFPHSKRLLISAFCLAFGNNAVAIAMWRNSLVFHSLDKVTSVFIHIMPCVTLHCLIHLTPKDIQATRFQAAYHIKYAPPGAPEHYSLSEMILWSTLPYAAWQLTYHFLISVRRREKIAAGRPTSFTHLRNSYSKTWLGKLVLSLPESLQEVAFMFIQYMYALLTMIPTPLWFYNRRASACFILFFFTWSVYNGAVYYIDVFGQRVQKELDQLRKDMARWQTSPELGARTPLSSTGHPDGYAQSNLQPLSLGAAASEEAQDTETYSSGHANGDSSINSVGSEGYFNITNAEETTTASSTGFDQARPPNDIHGRGKAS